MSGGVAEFRDFRLVPEHETWTTGGPVTSRLPEPEIEFLSGHQKATIAEPATMGLFGFATGTWMAGAVFGGMVSPTALVPLAIVLIFFAGVAQFIAGLYSWRRTNALLGNAMCSFGAYNTVVGILVLLEAIGFMPIGGSTATILGWFNISFGFIALAYLAASLRTNLAAMGVFFGLTCGYTLIGISQFGVGPGHVATTMGSVAAAGGALLFVAALCAFYLAAALIVNSTWKRIWLPLIGQP